MNIPQIQSSTLVSQSSFLTFKEQFNTVLQKTETMAQPIPLNGVKILNKQQLHTIMERQPTFSLVQSPSKRSQMQHALSFYQTESKIIEDPNNSISINYFETQSKNISLTEPPSMMIVKKALGDIQLINIQKKEANKIKDYDHQQKVFPIDSYYSPLQKQTEDQKNNKKLPLTQKIQLNQALILDILGESKLIFDKKIHPAFKSYLLGLKISMLFSTLILVIRMLQILFSTYKFRTSIYLFCVDIFLWDLGVVIAIKYLKVFKAIHLKISLLFLVISLISQGFSYYFSLYDNWDDNTIVIIDILLIFIETSQKWLNDFKKNLLLGRLLRNHQNQFKGASSSLLASFIN